MAAWSKPSVGPDPLPSEEFNARLPNAARRAIGCSDQGNGHILSPNSNGLLLARPSINVNPASPNAVDTSLARHLPNICDLPEAELPCLPAHLWQQNQDNAEFLVKVGLEPSGDRGIHIAPKITISSPRIDLIPSNNRQAVPSTSTNRPAVACDASSPLPTKSSSLFKTHAATFSGDQTELPALTLELTDGQVTDERSVRDKVKGIKAAHDRLQRALNNGNISDQRDENTDDDTMRSREDFFNLFGVEGLEHAHNASSARSKFRIINEPGKKSRRQDIASTISEIATSETKLRRSGRNIRPTHHFDSPEESRSRLTSRSSTEVEVNQADGRNAEEVRNETPPPLLKVPAYHDYSAATASSGESLISPQNLLITVPPYPQKKNHPSMEDRQGLVDFETAMYNNGIDARRAEIREKNDEMGRFNRASKHENRRRLKEWQNTYPDLLKVLVSSAKPPAPASATTPKRTIGRPCKRAPQSEPMPTRRTKSHKGVTSSPTKTTSLLDVMDMDNGGEALPSSLERFQNAQHENGADLDDTISLAKGDAYLERESPMTPTHGPRKTTTNANEACQRDASPIPTRSTACSSISEYQGVSSRNMKKIMKAQAKKAENMKRYQRAEHNRELRDIEAAIKAQGLDHVLEKERELDPSDWVPGAFNTEHLRRAIVKGACGERGGDNEKFAIGSPQHVVRTKRW